MKQQAAGGHFVQFYENDAFLISEVSAFIGDGMKAGEAGVIIATSGHRDALQTALTGHLAGRKAGRAGGKSAARPAARSKGARRAAQAAPCIVLDAEETLASFMVDGWPDERRFTDILGDVMAKAMLAGNGRVRVFGEMVALLWQAGQRDAAVRLEDLWNELALERSFSLFCAYPMQAFGNIEDGRRLMALCNAHSHVHPTESVTIPSDPAELGRLIVQLQHQATALQAEVNKRVEVEKALKRRERELADFLENAVEGIHTVAADGTVLWANQAELAMLGYAAAEYIGHHVAEFHADSRLVAEVLARLGRGETLRDQPARLRAKDGSIRHVLIHSNALFENGGLSYTRCFTRDVTDQVHLQAELSRRVEQLALADRRKDEFMAMLGHELRNPLAPIENALESMSAGDPSRVEKGRRIIGRQTAALKRMVDDLLDVSRMSAGTAGENTGACRIELRRENVLLQTVIERAVEAARPLIDEKGHTLSIHAPAEAIPLDGDPLRLAQVLSNLLNNAAKYTDSNGSIVLSASADRRDPRHGSLTISVRDNGIGLDARMREEVFGLFVQADDSRARSRGGLGIGLTLVRRIVQLHGGTVFVRSDGPGRGSEFILRLPLPAATATPKRVARKAPGSKPRRILVVDDNVDAAESLAECLRFLDHQVVTAHSGAAAIEKALQESPDLVILDIGLPEMDGYELARRLRAMPQLRSTVFVALSGYAQDSDVDQALQSGFDHHLSKPLDLPKLTALIDTPKKPPRTTAPRVTRANLQ